MPFLSPILDGIYDIIIVGGGTVGLLLANRLSQDSNTRVLVLEAGSDHYHDPKVNEPRLASTTWDDSHYVYNLLTVPQKLTLAAQAGLNNQRIDVSSGRGLGGSSAIDLTTFECPPMLFALDELGVRGCDPSEALKHVQKLYKLQRPTESPSSGLRSHSSTPERQNPSGFVKVSCPRNPSPLVKAWLDTFEELGYPITDDPIAETGLGGFPGACTIDLNTGNRSYAASAFYQDSVRQRSNLVVLSSARAEKIVLHRAGDSVIATGVRYVKDGIRHVAHTAKQIILSAGTFNSPKLLELSGIGSSTLLCSHGITPLIHNPFVGENLQDHLTVAVSFELRDPVLSIDYLCNPQRHEWDDAELLAPNAGRSRRVPSAAANVPLTIDPEHNAAFLNLLDTYVASEGTEEAIEYTHPARKQQNAILSRLHQDPNSASAHYAITETYSNPNQELPVEGRYLTLSVTLSHPFSRGSVHISSPSSTEPPTINPNYLHHPLDVDLLARHLHSAVRTLMHPSTPIGKLLKANGKTISSDLFFQLLSFEGTMQYVRNSVFPAMAAVGTCAKMSKELGGVVDEQGRVYGTRNLRIAGRETLAMAVGGGGKGAGPMALVEAERLAEEIRAGR